MNYTVTYSQRGLDALIMRLRGVTTTEIGRKYGVSRQRAYQLSDRALKRLFKSPHEIKRLIPAELQPKVQDLLTKHG